MMILSVWIKRPAVLSVYPGTDQIVSSSIIHLELDRLVGATEKQHPSRCHLKTVESAVLAGLEREMRNPHVIAESVRTYHEEPKTSR